MFENALHRCLPNAFTSLFSFQMSFDPGMLHNNGHTAYANGSGPGIRETGVVEKLLTSYGFIQCSERQARLFFHCSQYNGNLQELKIGGEMPGKSKIKASVATSSGSKVLSAFSSSPLR